MSEIDLKFMKGNEQTVKAMEKTYKEQKPKEADKTGKDKTTTENDKKATS